MRVAPIRLDQLYVCRFWFAAASEAGERPRQQLKIKGVSPLLRYRQTRVQDCGNGIPSGRGRVGFGVLEPDNAPLRPWNGLCKSNRYEFVGGQPGQRPPIYAERLTTVLQCRTVRLSF